MIELKGVSKQYPLTSGSIVALSNVSLDIHRGEFTVIVGQSGSGKSTLLGMLAGIDRPTSGEINMDGVAVHALSERAISAWRGKAVGIVFQFFQLLPTLTSIENVMLPMDFASQWPSRERQARALKLLDQLGVADQADKLPSRLSGGQQQRVAVARALANAPAVLLADEPTGNLDSTTAQATLRVLSDLVRDGQTVVMATHDDRARALAHRCVEIGDGRIVSDMRSAASTHA